MVEPAMTQAPDASVPSPPSDDENEALIDARKTFVITVVGSVLFCAAAAAVIFGLGL